jgi:PIN domain nuclease of toxin-antitoxin system
MSLPCWPIEPGSDAVEVVLAEPVISSVNWAKIMQKSLAAGESVDGMGDPNP